jgi:hypothetical protein
MFLFFYFLTFGATRVSVFIPVSLSSSLFILFSSDAFPSCVYIPDLSLSFQGAPALQFSNHDSDPEDRHWQNSPAWRAGWPRPTQALAAALWVAWFFEGEGACFFCSRFRRDFSGFLFFIFIMLVRGRIWTALSAVIFLFFVFCFLSSFGALRSDSEAQCRAGGSSVEELRCPCRLLVGWCRLYPGPVGFILLFPFPFSSLNCELTPTPQTPSAPSPSLSGGTT